MAADAFARLSFGAGTDHFPPSCLLAQAVATSPTADGHSPQVGWSFDGFPIYGPLGPGGVKMVAADLDSCGGKEEEIPGLDDFRYRYYFTGDTSNLYALPGYPMPDSSVDYPFAQACLRGCTMDQMTAGTCEEARSGVASAYVAATHSGYTTQFEGYGTSGTNSPLLGSETGMTTFLGCTVTPAESPPPSPPGPPLPPYTTPLPSPPPAPGASSSTQPKPDDKPKGGMIAGIVVGCLALVGIIGVAMCLRGRNAARGGSGTSTKGVGMTGVA